MKYIFTISVLCCFAMLGNIHHAMAQEHVAPLLYNRVVANAAVTAPGSVYKTTALSLPFFEDFTDYSPFPDGNKWEERYVYINNTMGIDPVSRGVATFDALNENGIPYNTNNSQALVYADTLTSKMIDISGNNPGDSIYLSFFYQPQGNGFYPETGDSLILYLKRKNGTWAKTWSKEGSQSYPFTQVMIPIRDTNFFSDNFQFRYVNKASINTNDDVWNLDYIRIATNRNMYDTLVNDIAMSNDPSSLLNDYTSMPYHQFLANPGKELASQHSASISNNTTTLQSVNISYTAKENITSFPLGSGGPVNANIKNNSVASVVFNTYSTTVPNIKKYNWVSYDNKYYIESNGATGPTINDTILKQQVFYTHLSYDDGTAEKSYFLNMFPTLPGKLAIEYHLNVADTMSGVAIYFGRQVPAGSKKFFSTVIYSDIAVNSGSDKIVYQEDFLEPGYLNTNYFYYYKFQTPVPLPAGTFYLGTLQPALSNSDSLYFGLDANRQTGNHVYYNVVGKWEGSTINGAVMVRPIFGPIIASGINDVVPAKEIAWSITPNPAEDIVRLHFEQRATPAHFDVLDMQGRKLISGNTTGDGQVDISALLPGLYIVHVVIDGKEMMPKKLLKL